MLKKSQHLCQHLPIVSIFLFSSESAPPPLPSSFNKCQEASPASHCDLLASPQDFLSQPTQHCIGTCDQEKPLHCYLLLYTAIFCPTLHYLALHCNILLYTAASCFTLQHLALHCNILLYTAFLAPMIALLQGL